MPAAKELIYSGPNGSLDAGQGKGFLFHPGGTFRKVVKRSDGKFVIYEYEITEISGKWDELKIWGKKIRERKPEDLGLSPYGPKSAYSIMPGTPNDKVKHYKLPKRDEKTDNVDAYGIHETSSEVDEQNHSENMPAKEESVSKSAKNLAWKFANSGLPGASSDPVTYWYPLKSQPGQEHSFDTMGLYDVDQGLKKAALKKVADGALPKGLDEKTVQMAEHVLEKGKSYEEHRSHEGTPESGPYAVSYKGKRLGKLFLEMEPNGSVMLRDADWNHYKTIFDSTSIGKAHGYWDNDRLKAIKDSLSKIVKRRGASVLSSMVQKMGFTETKFADSSTELTKLIDSCYGELSNELSDIEFERQRGKHISGQDERKRIIPILRKLGVAAVKIGWEGKAK